MNLQHIFKRRWSARMTPVHVFPPLCVFSLEVFKRLWKPKMTPVHVSAASCVFSSEAFKRLWKPKMTPVHVFAALCVLSLEAFTRFRFGSLFTSPVCFSEKPSKTQAKMIFYSKMIEKIEKCPYFSIKNGILLVFFWICNTFLPSQNGGSKPSCFFVFIVCAQNRCSQKSIEI